jgi:uncharacterized protein YkwD
MPDASRLATGLATTLVLAAAAVVAVFSSPTPGPPPAALAEPTRAQSGLTPRVVVPMLVRAADRSAPLAATVQQPAPATSPEVSAAAGPASTTGAMEAALIAGMNAERAARGLAPFTVDPVLTTIARTRSQQMASEGYFGHVDPRGRRPYVDLLAEHGITYQLAGENLALNNYAAAEAAGRALISLMASASHRENILEARFIRVGVGVVTTADGKHYFTTIFTG